MSDEIDVTDTQGDDQGYVLERKDISAILYAVDIEDRAQLTKLMEPLHAADIADLLEPVSYTHLRAHETVVRISYAVFCL